MRTNRAASRRVRGVVLVLLASLVAVGCEGSAPAAHAPPVRRFSKRLPTEPGARHGRRITKTFVAAEVLKLAERGAIDLDAPLSSYVPLPVVDRGASVRNALAMRSGIPDYVTDELLAQGMARPDRHWSPTEVVSYLPATPPSEPDRVFDYSNTNFNLLGRTIEKVSGQSLAHVLRAEVFDPSGLGRVTFQDAESPGGPLGRGMTESQGSGSYLPNRAVASRAWAAGGMAADAASVARWGYTRYCGTFLTAGSLAQMLPPPGSVTYGLGTMALTVGGTTAVGHSGSIPGYSTVLVVYREVGLSIAVLVPQEDVRPDAIAGAMSDAYNGPS